MDRNSTDYDVPALILFFLFMLGLILAVVLPCTEKTRVEYERIDITPYKEYLIRVDGDKVNHFYRKVMREGDFIACFYNEDATCDKVLFPVSRVISIEERTISYEFRRKVLE